jgi:outer membrane protein assembly factor BamB
MIDNPSWRNLPLLLTMALFVTGPCLSAPTRQTVGWRGDGKGVYPDAQPPVKWSATENVLWKTPLPRKSNASPILVGDRIFVCSEPDTLLCVSAKDGTILWSSSTT